MDRLYHTIEVRSAIQKVANGVDPVSGKVDARYFHLFNNIAEAFVKDLTVPILHCF